MTVLESGYDGRSDLWIQQMLDDHGCIPGQRWETRVYVRCMKVQVVAYRDGHQHEDFSEMWASHLNFGQLVGAEGSC